MKKIKGETKTESISLRVETKLKADFFKLLIRQDRTFSKWLRRTMKKELESDIYYRKKQEKLKEKMENVIE
jgi:hypothetical protein